MKQIEVTTGMNGYPQGLHKGFIDFLNFEEAEEFAKRTSGKVVSFCRREGHELWNSRGYVVSPYTLSADTFGENYREYKNIREFDEDMRERLIAMIDDNATIEQMQEFLTNAEDICYAFEDLEEGEVVLTKDGVFEQVLQKESNHDVYRYEIGVELFPLSVNDLDDLKNLINRNNAINEDDYDYEKEIYEIGSLPGHVIGEDDIVAYDYERQEAIIISKATGLAEVIHFER